jgi:pimeloyl-ACP methyl ester carboxylesterase
MCQTTIQEQQTVQDECGVGAPLIDVEGLETHGFCNTEPGVELYYALFGKGPTKVILLMGIATSGLAWKNQIEFFVRFPQFQVCVIDNRGCGRTVVPSGRITTSQMAQDVVALIIHLGWDKMMIHLVGNSLGGMIAQELALLVPNNIATLSLINTHAGGWKAYIPPVQAILSISRQLWAKGEKEQCKILMETVFSREFLRKPGRKEHLSIINGDYPTILDFYTHTFVERFSHIFKQTENAAYMFLQQLTAVLTHRVSWRRLSTLRNKFPTVVIVGTGDKVVHPRHAHFLTSALRADIVKFEGAGHAVTEECLDKINETLYNHFCKYCN